MGRTFKDQHKWEKKQRGREDTEALLREGKRKGKKHLYAEIIPEDDELDPYELIDYRDYK